VKGQDLKERRQTLAAHIGRYFETHSPRLIASGAATEGDLSKWRDLFDALFEDEAVRAAAEPFTAATRVRPSEYYLRFDGIHVFPEALLRGEDDRPLVEGNPMRFPFDADAPVVHRYRSDHRESILGIPTRSITTVLNDQGVRDHASQMEEMEHIRLNQAGSRIPSRPSCGRAALPGVPLSPEDFVVFFPCAGPSATSTTCAASSPSGRA